MTAQTYLTPEFCQYANGPCDQDLASLKPFRGFFIYPSRPSHLAQTSLAAVEDLRHFGDPNDWRSWQHLQPSGQLIFCEICKAVRAADKTIADITKLNFNVLFEIGYALGLRRAILPVCDTSFDVGYLDDIGIFDVIGHDSFQNSRDIVSVAQRTTARSPFSSVTIPVNREQPIYFVKAPIETNGGIKLLSCLKKSFFRFRAFDPHETPRLTLHEAYRQVMSSLGVVAHLVDPERDGAAIHNARAAFMCGMAMAAQRRVLMLQEGFVHQPIDYRDIVQSYDTPSAIAAIVEKFVRGVAEAFQSTQGAVAAPRNTGILEKIDLGDVAAENEIEALKRYFVRTPHYQQTVQGHTRIVVGRKGCGKTAIFYAVREVLRQKRAGLILDLKPEGHQLIKLRDAVIAKLSEGYHTHTLVVFWEYLLLLEITRKILDRDVGSAYRNPGSLERYKALRAEYSKHASDEDGEEGDFSERILALVDRVISRYEQDFSAQEFRSADVTALICRSDIGTLRQAILTYLGRSEEIWILFDNIDKAWPARGARPEDVVIVRSLLEASRKVQRMFDQRGQTLRTVVFLRKDVYDLLVDQTPDRGKDAAVNLDWSDVELIKRLLMRRFETSAQLSGDFSEAWALLCDTHVRGTDSLRYVLERTFLRPRDILSFVRQAVQIAVSREHERVEEDDFIEAEKNFSEAMVNDLKHEMRDVFPLYTDIISAFRKSSRSLTYEDVRLTLLCAEVPEMQVDPVLETLLWFGFLGVITEDDERFAYRQLYNVERLRPQGARWAELRFAIHPAFHVALELERS